MKNNKDMEKALIPNAQIEQMFLRIADDEQVKAFVSHVDNNRINLATAYASKTVTKKFFEMIEKEEATPVKEKEPFIINYWGKNNE